MRSQPFCQAYNTRCVLPSYGAGVTEVSVAHGSAVPPSHQSAGLACCVSVAVRMHHSVVLLFWSLLPQRPLQHLCSRRNALQWEAMVLEAFWHSLHSVSLHSPPPPPALMKQQDSFWFRECCDFRESSQNYGHLRGFLCTFHFSTFDSTC